MTKQTATSLWLTHLGQPPLYKLFYIFFHLPNCIDSLTKYKKTIIAINLWQLYFKLALVDRVQYTLAHCTL